MLNDHREHATGGLRNRPKTGDLLSYEGRKFFTVTRVEGSLCHTRDDRGFESMFIWRFRAGAPDEHLNTLFTLATRGF